MQGRWTPSRLFAPLLVALYCAAAWFILLAAYSFVRGFWQLLLFLAGILYYGPVTLKSYTFPEQLGRATAALVMPVSSGAMGALCWVVAKRMRARLAPVRQADDARAPVVYLRSFHVDRRLARRPLAIGRVVSFHTEEEQLVRALQDMGPVIAIGRPGERLPRLGAQRLYVEDGEWQQQIVSWFRRAAVVAIHVPPTPTEGLTWEVEQSLGMVPLDRLVFLVSREVSSFDWLSAKLQARGVSARRPARWPRPPYGSAVSGLVHFLNGQPEFRPLVKPSFFHRPFSSLLVPVYRSALQPVTARIAGSWQPLAPGFGDAAIAGVWIGLCLLAIAAALHLRRTEPLEREFMICGQQLWKHFPPQVRQLAEERDKALYTWMQSHIQRGLRFVPDDVVLAKAGIVRRLLAMASPEECAGVAEGTLPPLALDRMFNELGRQDSGALTTWCAIHERTLAESLEPHHAEAFPVSTAGASAAFARLREALPEDDRARFDQITDDLGQAGASDRCWYVRTILQGVDGVAESSRSTLARVALGQDVEE